MSLKTDKDGGSIEEKIENRRTVGKTEGHLRKIIEDHRPVEKIIEVPEIFRRKQNFHTINNSLDLCNLQKIWIEILSNYIAIQIITNAGIKDTELEEDDRQHNLLRHETELVSHFFSAAKYKEEDQSVYLSNLVKNVVSYGKIDTGKFSRRAHISNYMYVPYAKDTSGNGSQISFMRHQGEIEGNKTAERSIARKLLKRLVIDSITGEINSFAETDKGLDLEVLKTAITEQYQEDSRSLCDKKPEYISPISSKSFPEMHDLKQYYFLEKATKELSIEKSLSKVHQLSYKEIKGQVAIARTRVDQARKRQLVYCAVGSSDFERALQICLGLKSEDFWMMMKSWPSNYRFPIDIPSLYPFCLVILVFETVIGQIEVVRQDVRETLSSFLLCLRLLLGIKLEEQRQEPSQDETRSVLTTLRNVDELPEPEYTNDDLCLNIEVVGDNRTSDNR